MVPYVSPFRIDDYQHDIPDWFRRIRMPLFDVIAFDADDTLWHNESVYSTAKKKWMNLLSSYGSEQEVEQQLDEREGTNLPVYGYGVKSFTLSMIETAIDFTNGKIRAEEIQQIIGFGKEMLSTEVQLFENVKETVSKLAESYTLMVITKGDLLDQERKLYQSGIDKYFECVEIISEKDEEAYRKILLKYHIQAERFIMVGNSLRSDILPVVKIGGVAVYVPAKINWVLDVVKDDQWPMDGHYEIKHIGLLPALIESLNG
jgi:putative hydrolase of the HAD superfamily